MATTRVLPANSSDDPVGGRCVHAGLMVGVVEGMLRVHGHGAMRVLGGVQLQRMRGSTYHYYRILQRRSAIR